jgi:4-amino-4-deoxy-L-arabinose transferase-like glycosyltransferase
MTKSQSQKPKAKSPKPKPELVIGHWSLVIVLLLLAWGLRLCWLEAVPPGWRDDELINIHALSGELLAGRFPLYFTGASGHEPLYHYLHAGVHAVLGFNVLSGHLLSVVCGTLTVALTYALAHRLFGRTTAAIASLALATSFWSLMYSRTAIRHINLPPFALAAFYLLWRSLADRSPASGSPTFSMLSGLMMGISLYIYPAARLLPVLLAVFAVYLALFHRDQFTRRWRGLLLALVVTAVLAVPLGVAIAQGTGADARLAELAVPLQELRAGNPRPLLEGTWKTLGMFHATGDPEWLYNIADRPVFNLPGGALLWAGVALCLYRWRRPRYFFLLLWLGLGLLPAFISTPPASLSHTILAQPVAYILPALTLTESDRWIKSQIPNPKPQTPNLKVHRFSSAIVRCSFVALTVVFLATNAVRDLHDYFITWPAHGMVRFLYRADYREAAHYLDTHPEITGVAISSALMGPWDRLALEVDIHRNDVVARLFNPERTLVRVAADAPAAMLLASSPRPAPPIDGFLGTDAGLPGADSPHLELYALENSAVFGSDTPLARFANGLELIEARWTNEKPPAPGQQATLLTTWRVAAPLDLPPLPVVANPPPPGVYSGPRLAVFAHLLAADGTSLAGDDGLWVDPLTLRPGDRFLQVHHFVPPPGAPAGPYVLELGVYDPMTGDRWPVLEAGDQPGPDHFTVHSEEEP